MAGGPWGFGVGLGADCGAEVGIVPYFIIIRCLVIDRVRGWRARVWVKGALERSERKSERTKRRFKTIRIVARRGGQLPFDASTPPPGRVPFRVFVHFSSSWECIEGLGVPHAERRTSRRLERSRAASSDDGTPPCIPAHNDDPPYVPALASHSLTRNPPECYLNLTIPSIRMHPGSQGAGGRRWGALRGRGRVTDRLDRGTTAACSDWRD